MLKIIFVIFDDIIQKYIDFFLVISPHTNFKILLKNIFWAINNTCHSILQTSQIVLI
ncbi:hypothetical protein LEQ41_01850 [Streptococcus agalactiae]|nr:hypothetical protein [Streptococcus agalactiae]